MQDIRNSIPAGNHGGARGVAIDTIVFHHIVGDAPAAIARFRTKGVEVSSTYIIGSDGEIYYTVSENLIPYTNGATWNPRSITIEHAGGHASTPYTEAMYKASIALCRDIMKRHKITNFKRHRDIMQTACPGGLDVERIVKEAKGGNMEPVSQQRPDALTIQLAYNIGLGRQPSDADLNSWKDKSLEQLMRTILASEERKKYLSSDYVEVPGPIYKKK